MEIVVLLGAPGSGKGTTASRLAARTGAQHVSSGDLLREAVRQGTPDGVVAAGLMQKGNLVPDELVARIVRQGLASFPADARVLLDGYPRTAGQARMLEHDLAGLGAVLRRVVRLDVPEEVIVERLAGRRVCPACAATYHVRTLPPRREGVCDACGAALVQRPDDAPATVRNRLEVHRAQSAAVEAWYHERGLLTPVDGVGTAETVIARLPPLFAA